MKGFSFLSLIVKVEDVVQSLLQYTKVYCVDNKPGKFSVPSIRTRFQCNNHLPFSFLRWYSERTDVLDIVNLDVFTPWTQV